MKLLSLHLRNFKGARALSFQPKGGNASVFGDNAVGKTTLADAWYWLLFGKDSLNSAVFEIKTLDSSGGSSKGLEHNVEAELEMEDGARLVLAKVYKEDWTKKRGEAHETFSGHTTSHFINTVPVQKKEYDGRIASICEEKVFRLLTDPTYFNEVLHWQERRRMLIDVCGDVSDADVIASNSKLEDLPNILGSHALDDYRKILTATKKKVNEQRESIPVRIDEVARSVPEAGAETVDPKAIAKLRKELQELQEKRARVLSGGERAEQTKKLRELEGELIRIESRLRLAATDAREEKLVAIRGIDAQIEQHRARVSVLESYVKASEGDKKQLGFRREALRDTFSYERAKGFEGEGSCPSCGQALPAEQIEAAKVKFNEARAKRLSEINEEASALKGRSEEIDEKVVAYGLEITAKTDAIAKLTAERPAEPAPIALDLEANPEYAEKLAAKRDVEDKIEELAADGSGAIHEIDEQAEAVKIKLFDADAAVANARIAEEATRRTAELLAEEKSLAKEFERLQREEYLTEEFIRTKVRMLTERINSRFTLARFKLFNELVNTGVEECCEATVEGVPYGSLNHGSRVNVGLDIIRALQAHKGFHPPVIIDGCESVTKLLPMDCQVIRLVVSEADKALRFETSAPASTNGAPKAQEELISA